VAMNKLQQAIHSIVSPTKNDIPQTVFGRPTKPWQEWCIRKISGAIIYSKRQDCIRGTDVVAH